ncbi:MAG: hypothetical protein E3J35_06870 [Methanomassiliicoccales archaeon]|nr:MAG: hypothetical protein E3J35_06870 [Methanomassiliicoccales archaeon]
MPEGKTTPKETRDLMLKDHDWLVNLHIFQLRQTWQTFYFFLIMNGIVVSALAFLLTAEIGAWEDLKGVALFGLGILGIFLCFVWFYLIGRGFRNAIFWLEKAKDIEKEIQIDGEQILRTYSLDMKKKYNVQNYLSEKWYARVKGTTLALLVPFGWGLVHGALLLALLFRYFPSVLC